MTCPDRLVVAGYDGSPGSEAALRVAANEARLRHARLLVVSAWRAPTRYYGTSAAPSANLKLAGDLRTELGRRLREAVERLHEEAAELDIEGRVVEGAAATMLTKEAADADLLVVGSRGLGGFRDLLLGSTSHQCALHASCPVLIVPEQRASGAV
jgi:nucleotide-binding universal stress UspA family protein